MSDEETDSYADSTIIEATQHYSESPVASGADVRRHSTTLGTPVPINKYYVLLCKYNCYLHHIFIMFTAVIFGHILQRNSCTKYK